MARSLRKVKGQISGSMRWDNTRPQNGALINTSLPRFRTWAEAMYEYLSGDIAEGRIKR